MTDAVSAAEDGDKVLLSRLVEPVSTAELAVLLADPEGLEDTSLDVGLEAAGEDGAETSVGFEDGPMLGVEGPGTIALGIGPLGDEDSVYSPPVDNGSAENGLPIGVVSVLDRPEVIGLAAFELVGTGEESSVLLILDEPALDGPEETRLSVTELGPAEDESDSVGDDSIPDVSGVRVVRRLLLVVTVAPREVTVTDKSDGLLGTNEEPTSPIDRLVYALDTVDDKSVVQVSTLVVVRSVIWVVDEFVAIVATTLVVIVTGRLGAGLAVVGLPTDSIELAPEEEGGAEVARVNVVSPNDDVWTGGTSDPGVSIALEELRGVKLEGASPDGDETELGLLEGLTLIDSSVDGAADVGTLDDTAPEDGTAEVDISPELWQTMSASCYLRGLAFTPTYDLTPDFPVM